MSFLKKLFGGGAKSNSDKGSKVEAEMEHEGFHLAATPMSEGGQYRICGIISKEIDGEMKSHTLIRSDLFSSKEQCTEYTFIKCKQMIKEQGDKLFR